MRRGNKLHLYIQNRRRSRECKYKEILSRSGRNDPFLGGNFVQSPLKYEGKKAIKLLLCADWGAERMKLRGLRGKIRGRRYPF